MPRSLTFLATATAVIALAACGSSSRKMATYASAPPASTTPTPTFDANVLVRLDNVHVTNTPTKAFRVRAVDTREAVAVGPAGYAVYTFQGETTHHIICQKTSDAKTNCWGFWPPVSVASADGISQQSGVGGKLGTFDNHGALQLTLNDQPVYYFAPDIQARNNRQATGDELNTFGSIWHIVTAR
jgi:predicted lipoprotein with Yx(FWY)xxD motif